MNCREGVERVSDYLEGALAPAEKQNFEKHLAGCAGCRSYVDQMRLMVRSLRAPAEEPVPAEARQRLLKAFREHHRAARTVPLGIGNEAVALGDHIAYFWETEDDFWHGVGFLEAGLRNGDFCVVFGHDEANRKVLDFLNKKGFQVQALIEQRRLRVLGPRATGDETLASIGEVFQSALAGGASTLRLLGNIGWGRAGWPEEDDILAFEAKVTTAARNFPCVIVCMYDERALAGRIILRGGFQTHPITVCESVVYQNPHYVAVEPYLANLRKTSG